MNLLVTFLIAVTIGIVGVAWVGVIVDKMTSPFISLLVFFPLFFLTIWLCVEAGGQIHRAENDNAGLIAVADFRITDCRCAARARRCPIASKAVPFFARSTPCS